MPASPSDKSDDNYFFSSETNVGKHKHSASIHKKNNLASNNVHTNTSGSGGYFEQGRERKDSSVNESRSMLTSLTPAHHTGAAPVHRKNTVIAGSLSGLLASAKSLKPVQS